VLALRRPRLAVALSLGALSLLYVTGYALAYL
jgi:hypothetical protein